MFLKISVDTDYLNDNHETNVSFRKKLVNLNQISVIEPVEASDFLDEKEIEKYSELNDKEFTILYMADDKKLLCEDPINFFEEDRFTKL